MVVEGRQAKRWKMALPAEVVDCFTKRAAAKDIFIARHASLNTIVFLGSKAALLEKKCQIFSMHDYNAFRLLVKAA